MKSLAESHKVFLVSLLQQDSEPADAAKLGEICTVVSLHRTRQFNPRSLQSFLGLFSNRPRSIVSTYDPAVNAAIQNAIDQVQPDVIVASTLDIAQYTPDNLNVPSVLIDHNCEFAVLKRNAEFVTNAVKSWRYEAGWKKSARWEAKICQQYTAVVMPTEEDRQHMLEFAPYVTNIHVIANGADTDRFDPAQWFPDKDRLMYNGALTYGANLNAVKYYASEIAPLLTLRRPNAKLMVTGGTHGVDLEMVNNWPGIELTGYVSDIRDELYRSAACVVPLRRGGGMRLKIPEAMAAGVPVVSTSMGAEGLDSVHNEHLLIADTPEDFVTAIERVLTDDGLVHNLRKNARKLMEDRYSWHILGEQFVGLVEHVASSYPVHVGPVMPDLS